MPVTPETHDLITRAWDNQHWSLWITNGGGGTFRDLWTANEYSSAGLYVSHTETPGRIYGMSLNITYVMKRSFATLPTGKSTIFSLR